MASEHTAYTIRCHVTSASGRRRIYDLDGATCVIPPSHLLIKGQVFCIDSSFDVPQAEGAILEVAYVPAPANRVLDVSALPFTEPAQEHAA